MTDDEESIEDKLLRKLEDTYTTSASDELVVRRYSDGTPVISIERTQRYRATPTWWDNGRNHDGSPAVRKVWTIEGPEPFGGLTAVDEAQALALADLLNNKSKGDHPSRCEQEPGDPT